MRAALLLLPLLLAVAAQPTPAPKDAEKQQQPEQPVEQPEEQLTEEQMEQLQALEQMREMALMEELRQQVLEDEQFALSPEQMEQEQLMEQPEETEQEQPEEQEQEQPEETEQMEMAQEPLLDEEQPEQEQEQEQEEAYVVGVSKPLGEISGLAVDGKGRLVAFHRGDRVWDQYTFPNGIKLNSTYGVIPNATIAVIDPETGKVVEEHGENMFYMPHGLTIDDKNNYWVTDVGSHQVHKLDASLSKPVLSIGVKMEAGDDESHLCQPTDVAVAKNGYFFVADGYCNSRVLKFSPQGKLVDVIRAPGGDEADWVVPHSLSLIEDLNLLCVADRENERVQCVSAGLAEGHRTIPAGIPITAADHIGRVYAIREKMHYLVGVTASDEAGTMPGQVFVMDMNSGKAHTYVKGIEHAHSLAVSPAGDVFVSTLHPNQIVKISLKDQF